MDEVTNGGNKKPQVFVNKKNESILNEEPKVIIVTPEEKIEKVLEVYNENIQDAQGDKEKLAIQQMRERTEQQLKMQKDMGVVIDETLKDDKAIRYGSINKEKNKDMSKDRNLQFNKFMENINQDTNNISGNNGGNVPPKINTRYNDDSNDFNNKIFELSQPNFNAPYDVISLPSKGKFYKNKISKLNVAYMTTADENILTSPNLVSSGKFLEIFINRKILNSDIRYRDLTIGDRSAIMIWLRATGYGEIYPVTLSDNGVEFGVDINLNHLEIKELNVYPDDDGLYTYELPLSKSVVRFRVLNCGDIDDIESMIEADKEANELIDRTNIYTLMRTIVEVDGNSDKSVINEFIDNLRIGDSKALEKYINSIDHGVDLSIEVETPGGGSLKTFLPLNIDFFWPDFRV